MVGTVIRKKVLPAALALALLVFFVLAAYSLFIFGASFKRVARFMVESAGCVSPAALWGGGEPLEPVTFLIYGVDAGEWVGGTVRPEVGRADTIVLVKADPRTKTASLLSIPRDTLVVIPGRPGDDKINHSYAFGRAPLLVETVEQFTGIAVDYYIGLNYLAVKDIVDLLGGVEFDVDRVIESRGLRLEPGLQLLDGDAAFAVVSTRRDPMGDIARVMRQQRFIKAVVKEVAKRPLDDAFYIMLAAWKHLDTNLDLVEAAGLAYSLKGISEANMTTAIVPGWFYNRNGISYWRPDLEETARLIKILFLSEVEVAP